MGKRKSSPRLATTTLSKVLLLIIMTKYFFVIHPIKYSLWINYWRWKYNMLG